VGGVSEGNDHEGEWFPMIQQGRSAEGSSPVEDAHDHVTSDHEVIRAWAEERGATPATTPAARPGGERVLRFDLPGCDGEEELVDISWDDWFATFDRCELHFLYRESKEAGRQSYYFRLTTPYR